MGKEIDIRAPIRYGEVEVDSSGNPLRVVLREVPVEPLTDDKIASIPLRERAKILQDMQFPYARPSLERQFHYGLKEVDPATLRLATAVIDMREKQIELNGARREWDKAKGEYEAEKQSIRRGERGGRRIELKVSEATASWQKQDGSLAQKEKTRRILKDTTVDIFIRDLFLQENGPSKLLLATEDLVSQSSFTRDDVLFLLQQASLRLRSRESHEDASFFKYKEGTDNFVQAKDAKVFRQIIEIAFTDPRSDNPLAWQLKQTSIDLLEFYWRNSSLLFGTEEKTPRMGLIHDIFYSAYLTSDLKVVEQVIGYVWGKLENSKILSEIKKEYERAGILASEALPAVVSEIEKDHHALSRSIPENSFFMTVGREYMEKWNPEKRRCVLEKYFDRIGDFNLISMLASSLSGKRDYFSDWYPQQQVRMGVINYMRYFVYAIGFDFIMANTFPNTLLFPSLAEEFYSQKQEAEKIKRRTGGKTTFIIPSSKEERQMLYEEARETRNLLHPELREDFRSNEAIFLLSSCMGIEDERKIGNISEQNKALFERIRDENLWFVAENGDQYGVPNNRELLNLSINALTFYPHPSTGGWRVEITTEIINENGNPLSYMYYLDRDGSFFLNSGARLKLPAWLRLPFERFILERLNFITSGVLGQRDHHGLGPGEETREDIGRRSHWRTLTSTPDRIYTLTSESAKRHADYVLEKYGIDIYEENLHRRSVGTLGQNQCVTFVKAVPKKIDEPNQIVFNPSLLPAA